MTGLDTPDYQRGTVAPGVILGSFTGADLSGTVFPPPNTDVLWIDSGQNGHEIPSVEDAGTGGEYPVYLVKGSTGFGTPNYWYIALIAAPSDGGIAIEWVNRDAVGWAVFGQAGGRMVYDLAVAAVMGANGAAVGSNLIMVGGSDGTDARFLLTDTSGKLQVTDSAGASAIGPPGHAPPTDAIQVAGTDGTDLRALKTDSGGVLQVSGSSFPSVYGTPGAAVPSDAIMVAGSDGTDLRVILTDGSGHPLPIDQNLKLVIGALASALPADAVLVAGSDGTDLRAVLLDSSGHQLTIDQNVKNVVAAINTATPADAFLIAGTDLTDLRPLFTDSQGRLLVKDFYLALAIGGTGAAVPIDAIASGVSDGTDLRIARANQAGIQYVIPSAPATLASDHPPNELLFAGTFFAATGNLVAAPGAGLRLRVFAAQLTSYSGTPFGRLQSHTAGLLFLACAPGQNAELTYGPSGIVLGTNDGIDYFLGAGAGDCSAIVVYTIETV